MLYSSDDEFINISGIGGYKFPWPEKGFELVSEADSNEDDEYIINQNMSDGEETESDNSRD